MTEKGYPLDDRKEFEESKRGDAQAMAEDAALRAIALDVVVESDRHNWSYQWSWLGVPIIQMPPDVIATQEVIWETRPQVIIETSTRRAPPAVSASRVPSGAHACDPPRAQSSAASPTSLVEVDST